MNYSIIKLLFKKVKVSRENSIPLRLIQMCMNICVCIYVCVFIHIYIYFSFIYLLALKLLHVAVSKWLSN